MQQLKFAVLIRVSTDRQAKRGESLRVQMKETEAAVKQLGGVLTSDCIYKGQEHATLGNERFILDRLLIDASKNKFDAVMVSDISRWGRDNLKSKEGLQVLKKYGIKFYCLTTEYKLDSPHESAILGLFGSGIEITAGEDSDDFAKNLVSIKAVVAFDVAVRHAQSFAAILDVTT